MESADQDISIPLIAPPHDETQPSEFSSGTDKEVEGGAPPSTSNTNSQQKGEVTALSLAMIIFFNASGGPFGTEPSVKAAGNLYAIIGMTLMPFLWAAPE
eukprot:scaffold59799_cov56-Cyclotella_meneghiniana.AAC.1